MKESLRFSPANDIKEARRQDYLQRTKQDHGTAATERGHRGFLRDDFWDKRYEQRGPENLQKREYRKMIALAEADARTEHLSDGSEYRLHVDDLTPEQLMQLSLDSIDGDGYLTFTPGGVEVVGWNHDEDDVSPMPERSVSGYMDESTENYLDELTPDERAELAYSGKFGLYTPDWEDIAELQGRRADFGVEVMRALHARGLSEMENFDPNYERSADEDVGDWIDGFHITTHP